VVVEGFNKFFTFRFKKEVRGEVKGVADRGELVGSTESQVNVARLNLGYKFG
jgi:hypothetical protein